MLIFYAFIGTYFLAIISCLSIFLYSRVRFNWLLKISYFLVLSLPFEFFPKLEIAGSSLRLSQILVLFGFWVLVLLFIKRDKALFTKKINYSVYLLLAFIVFSIPSWFILQDFRRFIVYQFATVLVFIAMFLISNFLQDISKTLKHLSIVIFGCSLYGVYQFIGDMAGLPTILTGLREHYTKAVFGVPRIQGTAVEPLYFAGMLLIAIFFWLTFILNDKSIFSFLKNDFINRLVNYIAFGILIGVFTLTISKSSIAIFILLLPFYLFFAVAKFTKLQFILKSNLSKILSFTLFSTSLFLLSSIWIDPIALLGEIGNNIIETLQGTSASAVERNMFIAEAIRILPNFAITGIGAGQYGTFAGNALGALNPDNQAIVNNVYLEVWLENGFLSFIVFLLIIIIPIYKMLKNLMLANLSQEYNYILVNLLFVLLAYYLQWMFFSPIFIMPIFILLGIIYRVLDKIEVFKE